MPLYSQGYLPLRSFPSLRPVAETVAVRRSALPLRQPVTVYQVTKCDIFSVWGQWRLIVAKKW